MALEIHSFAARDLEAPQAVPLPEGEACVFTHGAPEKTTPNEDAVLVLQADEGRAVLAVADGLGGHSAGERASAAALEALGPAIGSGLAEGRAFREAILSAFEAANQAVLDLRLGAATTLAVVEVQGRDVRTYHVGDSEVLVVGQRGRRKLQTVSHSPVGYQVEAGLLDEREALVHDDRHLISNALGDPDMRVEMSPRVTLAERDTVLVGSDGLFDNLHVEELVERIRKGPLARCARRLQEDAQRRMTRPREGRPSKPDDLSFVVYRPRPSRRASSAASSDAR